MGRSVKTVLLWFVLVLFFVVIYSTTADGRLAPAQATTLVILFVAVLGGLLFVAMRRGRRAVRENDNGVQLLLRGRHAAALERFEGALRTQDRPLFRFNAAVARARLFRFDEAIAALERLVTAPEIGPYVRDELALARALVGRATAQDRSTCTDRDDPLPLLVRSLHAARAGSFDDVEALLSRAELRQLGGFHRAMADALGALAARQLRDERRSVDRIGLFGEADPDGLLRHWPELAELLDETAAPRR